MQRLHGFFFFALPVAFAIGCTTVAEGPAGAGGAGGTGGASADQTDRCKASCDKMKFFDCNSADEQARCYADCNAATPDQISLFTGCAENSICDPQCRTTIQPKETAAKGGEGASPSSCTSACDKLVSCNFIPAGAKAECSSECEAKGYQYQIDCVNKTECASIKSTCGGGAGAIDDSDSPITVEMPTEDPAKACLDECDDINFFDCAPVEAYSECRDNCSSATTSKRDTFTACSKSSGVQCDRKAGCLEAFLK